MRKALVAGIALTALFSGSVAAAPTSAAPRLAKAQHDLYLDFNGRTGPTPSLASSGSAPVTTGVASSGEGSIVGVRRDGHGRAARLEPFDTGSPPWLAMVVVHPSGERDPFAPGSGSFVFGAAFKLDATSQGSAADDGNNLVQRGLYPDDAQFKIQVDGNRVSCRVKGSAGAVAVRADGQLRAKRWHRVRCARNGNTVTLRVVHRTPDGPVKRRWSRSGAIGDLAFSSAPPLSVGGKVDRNGEVIRNSSDQFNGVVDNVFFRRTGG